jgi:hypothetical protein
MHNLRIFFIGSPACGLDFGPEVPRCHSLTKMISDENRFVSKERYKKADS